MNPFAYILSGLGTDIGNVIDLFTIDPKEEVKG